MKPTLTIAIALCLCNALLAQRFEWVSSPESLAAVETRMPMVVDGLGNAYQAFAFQPPLIVNGVEVPIWPGMGGYDLALVKYAPDGTHLWTFTFGTVGNDYAFDLAVDGDGAAYVSFECPTLPMFTEDSTFANGGFGNGVMKVDAEGHGRRLAYFGAKPWLDAIRQEVYVAHGTTIARLDTALAVVWSHTATGSTPNFNGNFGNGRLSVRGDRVAVIGFDSGGDVSIGGLVQANNGVPGDQCVLAVFDTAGTGAWTWMSDGTNSGLEQTADVAVDGDGHVYVGVKAFGTPFLFAGNVVENSNSNANICALLKLDADGTELWSARFEPNSGGEIYSIAVNDASEVAFNGSMTAGGGAGGLATGWAQGMYVAKLASDGTPIWLKDDFGYAQNGSGIEMWLDDGPGGDLWHAVRNYAALNFDCTTRDAINANVARISDTQQVTPTADFSFSPTGLIVQFTDMSANGESWHWDFGDGQESSEQDPEHEYTAPGTYTVTLTVTAGACSAVSTQLVVLVGLGLESLSGPRPILAMDQDAITIRSVSSISAAILLSSEGRPVRWIASGAARTTATLAIGGLASGIYIVQVHTGSAQHSYRVIIR